MSILKTDQVGESLRRASPGGGMCDDGGSAVEGPGAEEKRELLDERDYWRRVHRKEVRKVWECGC